MGAVFGLTAGWERALWYARDAVKRDLPYSVGAQPWQAIVQREAAEVAIDAVLIDLSPFINVDVTGPPALASLNALAMWRLDVAERRAIYTQLLKPRCGIEAGGSITWLGEDQFRIASGAATSTRDLAYLGRTLADGAVITDRTDAFSTIGLTGAVSRDMLSALGASPHIAFGYASEAKLAGAPSQWATTLSTPAASKWASNTGTTTLALQ